MEAKPIPTYDTDITLDFNNLILALRRWSWLFIVAALIGAAAAFFFSRLQTPIYEATTNILVTRSADRTAADITQSLDLLELASTYVNMMKMREFQDIVSERVGSFVTPDMIFVKNVSNTQVVQLRVRDEDPALAAFVADTMVEVLVEQNENLQSSRYLDAEQSLLLQINEAEVKIAELQTQLDAVKESVLAEQVAETQLNISTTVDTIEVIQAELNRMRDMSWDSAYYLLYNAKYNLRTQQSLLDSYSARQEEFKSKLANDPKALTNPDYAKSLQQEIDELETKIIDRRDQIEDTQKEIDFLTPLVTPEGFDAKVIEKQKYLQVQQALLGSYQNVYTNLLSTEDVKRTTYEIDNLEHNLQLYNQIYLGKLSSLEAVRNQKLQNLPIVEQISPAIAGKNPVSPSIMRNTILGGLAGWLLVGTVLGLRTLADDSIKRKEDVEMILGVQVIGYITNIDHGKNGSGIYVADNPRSMVTEAFRSLRTKLELSSTKEPVKSILVTSSGQKEGKSTIAANLAASLANTGKSVLLVDADLRRPTIHIITGVSNNVGLSDLVKDNQPLTSSACIQDYEKIANLDILASGGLPPNPTELIGSDKMRKVIETLKASNDFIVIDSPPLVVADPLLLSALVDGVLLVMVPGKTRGLAVRALKEQIQQTGVRLLGVVFNRLQTGGYTRHTGYNYYQYPYLYLSDYYGAEDGKISKKRL